MLESPMTGGGSARPDLDVEVSRLVLVEGIVLSGTGLSTVEGGNTDATRGSPREVRIGPDIFALKEAVCKSLHSHFRSRATYYPNHSPLLFAENTM